MSEHVEPRLTEAEWRTAQARRECGAYGHDWSIIQTIAGEPLALHCERRCGAPSYSVTPNTTTTRPTDGVEVREVGGRG